MGTWYRFAVRIMAGLTEGLQLVNVTGPTKHQVTGQAIGFEPIPRLAVKADFVIRVKVKAATAGEARCKVHLAADEFRRIEQADYPTLALPPIRQRAAVAEAAAQSLPLHELGNRAGAAEAAAEFDELLAHVLPS